MVGVDLAKVVAPVHPPPPKVILVQILERILDLPSEVSYVAIHMLRDLKAAVLSPKAWWSRLGRLLD